MTRVVCWNMNYRRASWRTLAQMGADVALLQEPCKVPPDAADGVEISLPSLPEITSPASLAAASPPDLFTGHRSNRRTWCLTAAQAAVAEGCRGPLERSCGPRGMNRMRKGRPPATVTLTDEERQHLTSLAHRSRSAPQLARRARIILACANGQPTTGIVKRLHVCPTTVCKWRTRFLAGRVDGLADEPRSGAPRRITDAQVEDVVVRTLESTPRGTTHWSTRAMAKATGLSNATISRIWRAFGLQPHRTETFRLSPDPWLVDKVHDIVGLYVNPPEHAGVFCVDEKPQIMARRTRPLLPMEPGQPERRTFHYRRHGTTTSLFAALDVKTGTVIGQSASSTSVGRVREVPRAHRRRDARRVGCPPHPGQLQHAQVAPDSALAGQAPAVPSPVHPDIQLLAESGGALVRGTDDQATASWRASQRSGSASGNSGVSRPAQRRRPTVRVDEDASMSAPAGSLTAPPSS